MGAPPPPPNPPELENENMFWENDMLNLFGNIFHMVIDPLLICSEHWTTSPARPLLPFENSSEITSHHSNVYFFFPMVDTIRLEAVEKGKEFILSGKLPQEALH